MGALILKLQAANSTDISQTLKEQLRSHQALTTYGKSLLPSPPLEEGSWRV